MLAKRLKTLSNLAKRPQAICGSTPPHEKNYLFGRPVVPEMNKHMAANPSARMNSRDNFESCPGRLGLSEGKKMEALGSADIALIQDEKLEFDLNLSDSREDDDLDAGSDEEDEVFFGPVGHKERRIATSRDIREASPTPHNAEELLFKEAHFIANLFKKKSASDDVESTECEKENDDVPENKGKEAEFVEAVAEKVERVKDKEEPEPVAKGVLRENNSFCSPVAVKGRSPLVRSASRETRIQTPSKKKRAFSPVNVDHLYGVDTSQANSKTMEFSFDASLLALIKNSSGMQREPQGGSRPEKSEAGDDDVGETQHRDAAQVLDDSQKTQMVSGKAGRKSALRPPGFGMPRTRRRSSSSSTSSTSSTCPQNLNETFASQRNSSSSSLNSSFSSQADSGRQPVKTKSSLKPLGSGMVKPKFGWSSDTKRSKSKPVKALPRGQAQSAGMSWKGNSSFSEGCNKSQPVKAFPRGQAQSAGKSGNSSFSEGCSKPQPVKAFPRGQAQSAGKSGKGNSSFSEGCTAPTVRRRGSGPRNNSDVTPSRRESNHVGHTTPTQGSKTMARGLPPRGQERQKGVQGNGKRMQGKREGTASQSSVPSKVGSASPARRGAAKLGTRQSESIPRKRSSLVSRGNTPSKQTTPVKGKPVGQAAGHSTSKAEGRKSASLGGGRNKRRSLLPTPVSSKPSEPKIRRSNTSIGQQNATGPIPFNISPVVPATPKNAVDTSEEPGDLPKLSDPFSPLHDDVLTPTRAPAAMNADVSEDLISL